MQILADGLVWKLNNEGAKLLSNVEIRSNNYAGVEVRMLSKSSEVGILRYILVENRLFILSSGWKNTEDGTEQLKTLDSFKLTDSKAIFAKKIEEATPASLPQFPAAKRLKSDIENERLKGKVKSVTETEEDFSGTWYSSGVKMSSEEFYNEDGNQIKSISYDYKGNPSDITVFGYINGMRVLKSGSIDYEYNPPLVRAFLI